MTAIHRIAPDSVRDAMVYLQIASLVLRQANGAAVTALLKEHLLQLLRKRLSTTGTDASCSS